MHESILGYKKARYAWLALLLTLISCLLYWTQRGPQPANGGTWQGYVLGTAGALLIVWLSALGVRKRRYRSAVGSLQGWASAHVYLGVALVVVATLHCAAQFGWNVHTLAYVLMCAVIASGLFGLFAYLRFPRLLARNRADRARDDLFAELNELNELGRSISQLCDPDVRIVTDSAISRTTVGGGLLGQLCGLDHSQILLRKSENSSTAAVPVANRDQRAAVEFVARRIPRANRQGEAERLQHLLAILCRRQTLLRQLRRDIQLQGWLQLWLYVHVPLTVALLVALALHIVAVFFFW